MNTPLISFIIIDRGKNGTAIKECAESILALQLREEEREIIVVGDGTPLAEFNAAESIADEMLLVRQPHAGISAARNLAMRIARGKYIQILDADTSLLPAAYGHCVDVARYNSPDIITFRSSNNPAVDTPCTEEKTLDGIRFMRETGTSLPDTCRLLFTAKKANGLSFNTEAAEDCADEEFATLLILRADTITETDTAACCRKDDGEHKGVNRRDKRLVAERLDDDLALILRLDNIAQRMPPAAQKVLRRRVALLTAEYIVDVLKLTRSRRQIRMRVETLRQRALFPIAYSGHSAKYFLINKLCAFL